MNAKSGKKRSWFYKLFVFLNIIAVLALLASYAALFVDPRDFWPFAFAGLAYPVILFVNVFFILCWLVTWRRLVLLSLIPVLAGWTQITTLIPIHFGKPGTPDIHPVTVLTYNIHGFNYTETGNAATQEAIARFLKKEKPSVVCFQEFKPRGEATVQSLGDTFGLPNFYQKNYLQYKDPDVVYGMVIYSRDPILQTGYLRDDRNRAFAIWADVLHDSQTYRIYNCHLVSVRFGSRDYSFYEDLKNQETEGLNLKDGLFSILRKLKRAFLLRSEQSGKLAASVNKSPHPVILAGDLNDSPFSHCYHQLTRALKDSYKEAGTGWGGNTFAGQLPSYRIDYILHDKRLKAVHYQRHSMGFSDHFPVSVVINPVP